MTLKQIEGFCYLAQTLNFSKAAELLFLSQPAFSRMIVSMEKELGCQLFIRSKTEPKLTLAGEQIYQHMKVMLREYEDINGIAKLASQDKLGSLRIGMLDNGLTEKSRNLILGFQDANPDVELILREYSEVEIFRALEMGWIDVALVIHFPEIFRQTMTGIVTETSRECVILHRSNPLSQKEEVEIAELKNEKFIMLRESKSQMGYNMVMSECLRNGFTPDIVMKADSVSSALSAVACNIGCTILTDALQHLPGEDVLFIPIAGSTLCDHWLVWNKEIANEKIPELKAFIEARI
ncbi:transcriptional regulator [Clostridium sp. SY8519]|uniref:LysR family transcriptional regulator n=1 Tax=Clostridium sp. (strain SY8519) TaxID=1042156 RepID=UPI0002171B6E|nr:LysR family transcriptional regulator [Clostridium sp. SY8519]BAK47586.1 transcriptional regulator [Clostridium sp. SY8519]